MSEKKELRLVKTRAELWRTVASIVQLFLTLATLIILIVVHFL